ncbi:unnamed protein product [Zymoseptoria tritici ST99CH_1E4]|uniref:Uncharacterized protein n=1 Tax=Zymoseptoria tritici ST99CH_1E4 TaxID=1276532 RepID=A0A2H1G6R9_ZYMTR|nr:unnamed protein product [Zymoseptoria tritici ST99CH_1E4]
MGGSGKPLRYDAPVDLAVMRSALRAIATNAGVVDAHTIQLYDIRCGMIRAGAHVADSVKGIAGRAAASIAGHSVQALNNGLTAMYAGHVQTAVYNKIAADALPDRLAPRTDPSVFSVQTTVMPSQIASYKQKHPGVSTDNARRAIVLAITSDPNRA